MLPVIFGSLALTLRSAGRLTPWELINMYHGYLWRQERADERLARFVTLWLANMAGRVRKHPLKLTNLFPDGRFRNKDSFAEFMKEFDE